MGYVRPAEGYREMLLLELIEQYHPVYPEGADWIEAANFLYDQEPAHMAALTASLEGKGWREPIVLSEPDDLEEGEAPRVLNGTHRVAIALREGVISVPVTSSAELRYKDELQVTELTIDPKEELTDDEGYEIFDVLRSFELTGDLWLDVLAGSSSGGRWHMSYDPIDGELLPSLERRARSILKESFPGRSFELRAVLETFED